MTGTPRETVSGEGRKRLPERASAAVRFTLALPVKIAARLAQHSVQILFAIFVLFLHPQLKWLLQLIVQSAVFRDDLKPSLRLFAVYVFDPYFAFLGRLPPYWATFSIGLPLAVLEPAKLAATILVAQRPKAGIVIWLALQGVSLLLIDRTWTAVRPQSRKIWSVSHAHAWLWLNAEHGKYWIRNSRIYRTATIWGKNVRRSARRLWLRLTGAHSAGR
jgi:hypothetical protein